LQAQDSQSLSTEQRLPIGRYEQATTTFVTFAPATVPAPLFTTQLWAGPPGCVSIATLYDAPSAITVAKVNEPFDAIPSASPPLFWSKSPFPTRPLTVPPME
jgi:hypothetical protein